MNQDTANHGVDQLSTDRLLVIGRMEDAAAGPRSERARQRKQLRASLRQLIGEFGLKSSIEDRDKLVNSDTARLRFAACWSILNTIFNLGYEITSVHSLRWKHIVAWVEYAKSRYRPKTMQTYFSHVRWLLLALNKHELRERFNACYRQSGNTSPTRRPPGELQASAVGAT